MENHYCIINENAIITMCIHVCGRFCLAFRDHLHLHIFVGQTSPSFSSTICLQSCQLSVHIFHIFPVVVYPCPFFFSPVLPCSSFFVIFSSLLMVCPYQLNHFCLRNVDIWHTFASSCIVWFFDNDMVSFLLHFGLFCYV